MVLLGLCLAQQPSVWATSEAGTPTHSDSRADPSGLPADVQPWWPSRYGADDQLGTLNEITPEVVRAATALVKTGTIVDLGRILDEDTPKFPGRYWHQTADVSPHFTNLRRPDVDGKGWGKNQINWITEIQVGTFQVGTQLDSIGHIQIGDRFYNGWTTRDVVESWGLNRFGTETVPPIVTRGVLVDIAAYKSVERLAKGYVIGLADVQGALKKQGVTLRPGDAVLVSHRLGRPVGPGQRRVSFRRARSRFGGRELVVCAAHRLDRRRYLELRAGARRRSGTPLSGSSDHVREDGIVRLRESGDRRVGAARRPRIPVHRHPCQDPWLHGGGHRPGGGFLRRTHHP
jgi:hypothetical protein